MAKEKQWEEISSEQGKFVRWEEEAKKGAEDKTVYVGTVVEGVYSNKSEGVGENGATVYTIDTVDHGSLAVWGSTVLKDKMEKVAVGSEVRIEMTGTQKPKNGGKAYFLFKVMARQAPMREVGAPSTPGVDEAIDAM